MIDELINSLETERWVFDDPTGEYVRKTQTLCGVVDRGYVSFKVVNKRFWFGYDKVIIKHPTYISFNKEGSDLILKALLKSKFRMIEDALSVPQKKEKSSE